MSTAFAEKSAAQHAAEYVIQLATGYMPAVAIHAAARLGIPDLLASGPKPVTELARSTNANEDALYRVLRALSSLGVFAETAPRIFASTPVSDSLRTDAGPLRDMVLWISDSFHMRTYAEFMHSVMTGETVCQRVLGMPIFDYFAQDHEEAAVFNKAMTGWTAFNVPAYLAAYDFSGIGTLVDVAGGHGSLLTSILAKYPGMKGVLFDLPHVVEGAKPRLHEMGLTDRCRLASGDFFQSVPSGDAIVMRHIIHDWDDERAALILRNCHKALPAGGKVIILDTIIQPGDGPGFEKWLDLEMLVLPGGRERTEAEFKELLQRAGFRLTRVVPTEGVLSVIEAVKS